MTYIVFILNIISVISFLGFSSKPSPIYGGFSLVVVGGVGCGIVVNFGVSFLGLMVFLIYLGGCWLFLVIQRLWLLKSTLRFGCRMRLCLVLLLLVW
ncbi:NADH-ubiquinone oxidoreductase chain 6 [Manis javanica]|nr:NADH-ubiquinone oxidoreductase chain 6 [Manis javanica]